MYSIAHSLSPLSLLLLPFCWVALLYFVCSLPVSLRAVLYVCREMERQKEKGKNNRVLEKKKKKKLCIRKTKKRKEGKQKINANTNEANPPEEPASPQDPTFRKRIKE